MPNRQLQRQSQVADSATRLKRAHFQYLRGKLTKFENKRGSTGSCNRFGLFGCGHVVISASQPRSSYSVIEGVSEKLKSAFQCFSSILY